MRSDGSKQAGEVGNGTAALTVLIADKRIVAAGVGYRPRVSADESARVFIRDNDAAVPDAELVAGVLRWLRAREPSQLLTWGPGGLEEVKQRASDLDDDPAAPYCSLEMDAALLLTPLEHRDLQRIESADRGESRIPLSKALNAHGFSTARVRNGALSCRGFESMDSTKDYLLSMVELLFAVKDARETTV